MSKIVEKKFYNLVLTKIRGEELESTFASVFFFTFTVFTVSNSCGLNTATSVE